MKVLEITSQDTLLVRVCLWTFLLGPNQQNTVCMIIVSLFC